MVECELNKGVVHKNHGILYLILILLTGFRVAQDVI